MPQVILMAKQCFCPECRKPIDTPSEKCPECGSTTQLVEAAFCICEYIPDYVEGQDEAAVAEQTFQRACFKCGYRKDSEDHGIQIYCFHRDSPYLAQVLEKIQR